MPQVEWTILSQRRGFVQVEGIEGQEAGLEDRGGERFEPEDPLISQGLPNRGQRDIEYCRGLKEEGKFRIIVVALYDKQSKMRSQSLIVVQMM